MPWRDLKRAAKPRRRLARLCQVQHTSTGFGAARCRLTGSYGGPAALAGRLEAELPATTVQEYEFEVAPSDLVIDQALRLARLWRRLAEARRLGTPRRCLLRQLLEAGIIREATGRASWRAFVLS
jgi:hypothetical protein